MCNSKQLFIKFCFVFQTYQCSESLMTILMLIVTNYGINSFKFNSIHFWTVNQLA